MEMKPKPSLDNSPNPVDTRLQKELVSLVMSGGNLRVSVFPEGETIFSHGSAQLIMEKELCMRDGSINYAALEKKAEKYSVDIFRKGIEVEQSQQPQNHDTCASVASGEEGEGGGENGDSVLFSTKLVGPGQTAATMDRNEHKHFVRRSGLQLTITEPLFCRFRVYWETPHDLEQSILAM